MISSVEYEGIWFKPNNLELDIKHDIEKNVKNRIIGSK